MYKSVVFVLTRSRRLPIFAILRNLFPSLSIITADIAAKLVRQTQTELKKSSRFAQFATYVRLTSQFDIMFGDLLDCHLRRCRGKLHTS